MSLRLLSDLRGFRSREIRLSRTGCEGLRGLMLREYCSTASKNVSSAISWLRGGVQVLVERNGLGLPWGG